ncbi:MAG: sensor histidine kinase [Peptostreptococcaceae bacterium]
MDNREKLITKFYTCIINIIRKRSISKRLITSFLIISMLPIILTFLLVHKTSLKLIKNSIIENDKISSQLISDSITTYISKFDSITNEIIWNNKLMYNIPKYDELNDKEKEVFNEQLSNLIKVRTTYASDIADFTILTSDLKQIHNEGFSYIPYDEKIKYILNTTPNNSTINWSSIRKGKSNYIVTAKSIKSGNEVYGYVFLAMKEKVLINMFKDYNKNFGGAGFILDKNNRIIAANCKIDESKLCSYEISTEKLEKISNSSSIVKINNKKYMISSKGINYAPWNLISIIPYDYIYSTYINVYKIYIIIAIMIMIITIFIAIIIYKSITQPLDEIVTAMNKMDKFTVGETMQISGSDEISFIMKKYNEMSKGMQNLINDVKQKEIEKKEVTLRLLQAQINPHFLFNTLGSLRYLSIMKGDDIVSNGLEALAKLLRNIILNKDDFVSIDEEIENVKNYITIQKIRYGDNFDMKYFVNENTKNEKILKFILQPVVENCILHGFKESNSKNYISITINKTDSYINFKIYDNGVGINGDRLENGYFNIDKFAGIGVKNIKERLSIYYEEDFIFEIKSEDNKGTTTYISIPRIKGSDN